MTDSRAALEERALYFMECHMEEVDVSEDHILAMADFAEQESSSLKLLVRSMCWGIVELWGREDEQPMLAIYDADGYTEFPVELDSSGIPVLTPEIIEALKNAAIF